MPTIHDRLTHLKDWQAPSDWLKISTLDTHTGGEPLRIVLDGLPEIKGNTILERRNYMRENLDYIRQALIFEPRGHADQYAAVIMPPSHQDADFSVLFLHNEGYSTMCGHAIIALTKVMLETGTFPISYPQSTLKIEVPSGIITAFAECRDGRVEKVWFHNVPSFAPMLEQTVNVPGFGEVQFDLGFGGAFYAYVDAKQLGLRLTPENYQNIIAAGKAIKHAVADNFAIKHPFEDDLSFLYGTIFIDDAEPGSDADSRNVCIFAEGELDRSPTGSGVAGRMAIHHAKGEIKTGEKMRIESILGSVFTGSVIEETTFGEHPAVIPQVEGNAWISGKHEFIIDPSDPLKNGFIFR